MGRFAVILPAAGRSSRFGDPKQKKIYAELEGRAVWLRAVEPFVNRDDVGQIILAIAPEDRELFDRRYRASVAFMNIKVIDGGDERYDTVARALEVVEPGCDFIAVHDAARPCLSAELIEAVFAAALEHGAALLASPVAETIKRAADGRFVTETVSRGGLYLAQTPQAFERSLLCQRLCRARPRPAPCHRRLPARRGARAAHRGRSRLGAQHQDHHAARSQARGRHPAAPGEAQARIRAHIRFRTNRQCGAICPS